MMKDGPTLSCQRETSGQKMTKNVRLCLNSRGFALGCFATSAVYAERNGRETKNYIRLRL